LALTEKLQRFCPVCDDAFSHGEAVVLCNGCQVMYHSACWNRKGGCTNPSEHVSRPVALAYGVPLPDPPVPPDPHEVRASRPPVAPESRPPFPPDARRVAIGERPRHAPPYPTGFAPGPEHDEDNRPQLHKPMPRVYGGPGRWLRYWYVPVAAALAAGIAYGIVAGVDRLAGDDGPEVEGAASTTVTSEATLPGAGTSTPAGGATPAITAAPGATLAAGGTATVTGTGDCLNMRVDPSVDSAIIVCLGDGTVVSLVEGPSAGGGRNWWRVTAGEDTGWVAEEYLVPR
jgi:hypothetical protein